MVDSGSKHQAAPGRAFTVKALVFGLLGACGILVAAALGNLINQGQTPLIGQHLPPAPFAFILLLTLLWNPTIGRIRGWRFSPRELAVVFGLTLFLAWIPYSGLLRYLQRGVVMPQIQADTKPEWRKQDILGHLPAGLFPQGGSAEAAAFTAALGEERGLLIAGGLDSALAKVGSERGAYATALDLASLVPPKLWQDDDDQVLARTVAERAMQRIQGERSRWSAVAGLLATMPDTLGEQEHPPAAWRLVRERVTAGMVKHLPEARREFDRVYSGMMQGLTVGDHLLTPDQVPVASWLPTLVYWGPLIIFFSLAVLMLSLVVHRQWSHHEQLNYPIALVGSALIQRSQGRLVSDIMHNRLFWWGCVPVLLIHGLNYLAVWFPGRLPFITLGSYNFEAVQSVFSTIGQSGGAENLTNSVLFFSVVGLAYFIASEVSLSLGLSGLAVVLLSVEWYATTGTTTDLTSARSGAYVGYAGVLLFTGRTYYWTVLCRAFGIGRGEHGDLIEPVWAARLFLLGFAGLVAVLVAALGMDWLVATVYCLTLMVLFLVISRIVCETGIPFIQAGWQPVQLMGTMMGVGAIGPGALVIIGYLGSILTQDPRECLMPYSSTAFKIAETAGVPRLRFAVLGFGAIVLGLVIGIAACTWGLYNFGSSKDGWAQGTGAAALDDASRGVAGLISTSQYAISAGAGGLGKLPLIADNLGHGKEIGWTLFGLFGVVAFSFIRFRFTGFILHPVLFLVWATYPAQRVWFSFLLGWIIKSLVVRFGGGRVYQDLKPLFIGLIAGELVAASLTIFIGWLYYFATGLMPRTYMIMSG